MPFLPLDSAVEHLSTNLIAGLILAQVGSLASFCYSSYYSFSLLQKMYSMFLFGTTTDYTRDAKLILSRGEPFQAIHKHKISIEEYLKWIK